MRLKEGIDRFLLASLVALAATDFDSAEAEEPTIAQLIEGVPSLTTTDPKLTAFSVRLTTSVPFGMPFTTRAVWRRDGGAGLLTTAGEGQSPVWFLSDSRSAFFDVCTGSVLIKKGGRLKLNLRVSGETVNLDYGIGSGDEHRVDVGLRSFFDDASLREGAVSRTDDGAIRIESKVSACGYRTIAVFDGSEPHSLRSLEIKRADGDVSVLRLDDIQLNDEVEGRWPELPAPDAFPPGIRVIESDEDDDVLDAPTQVLWLTRSQIGYAGLREEKWRKAPNVAEVDWSAAMEHARSLESLGANLTAEADGASTGER